MATPKKYRDELRERATRMALDAIEAEWQRMAAFRRVHGQLGQHTPAEVEFAYQAAGYDQTTEPTRAG